MEPLIHMPSDTDPGLPALVTPDKNHILDLRGRDGTTDTVIRSLHRTGLLKGVRTVDLGYCERITDETIELLSTVPTLTRLNLEGCWRLTARGLASLVASLELANLDVSSCDGVDDLALGALLCIPGLKILKVRKTPITLRGFRNVSRPVRLERLDVRGCKSIQSADLDEIARMLHLGHHDILHD